MTKTTVCTEEDLGLALEVLRSGGLALLPTETVYGVGVSVGAFSSCGKVPGPETGYGRIFSLKRRDLAQTVPWLVDGPEALERYAVDVPSQLFDLARTFWPGALTLVVPAAPCVPDFMRAADGTVALRASASPVIQRLIRELGFPLAVTSANTHGMPAPAAFTDVEPRIFEGVDVAVDAGETPCRDASTIVAMREGKLVVLREGALLLQDVQSL